MKMETFERVLNATNVMLALARFAVYVGLCAMGCKCLYEHDMYRSLVMFALAILVDIAEGNSK